MKPSRTRRINRGRGPKRVARGGRAAPEGSRGAGGPGTRPGACRRGNEGGRQAGTDGSEGGEAVRSRSLMAPSWDRAAAAVDATSFGVVSTPHRVDSERSQPIAARSRPVGRGGATQRAYEAEPTKKKTASRWGGAVKQIAENRRKAIEAAHEDAAQARQAARGARGEMRSSRKKIRRRMNGCMRRRGMWSMPNASRSTLGLGSDGRS